MKHSIIDICGSPGYTSVMAELHVKFKNDCNIPDVIEVDYVAKVFGSAIHFFESLVLILGKCSSLINTLS